jgi:integrase
MNTNSWKQVLDGANRRVRGLWLRNGSYSVQTTVLDARTGVKVVRRIPLEAKNLPDAKNEMGSLLQTISENGTIHGNKGETFSDYRKHYVENAGKAEKTLYNEDHFLRQWEKFLGASTRITEITPTNILGYRHACEVRIPHPLSPRTINLHIRALVQLLKMAKLEGYIAELPTKGITALKEISNEKTLFSIDQLCEIGAEALRHHRRTGEQVADWVALAMYSGGRVTELLKLKWSNVDWTQKQLVFSAMTAKSGESRRVDFSKNLENQLKAMKAKATPGCEYLFPSFRSDKETTSFKKTIWAIRDELKFNNFTPHSTRHHFISECVMKGIDYLTIARWVGHKDGGILIGKIYGHLNNAHMKEQAAKLN